jgi:hypothetical protein
MVTYLCLCTFPCLVLAIIVATVHGAALITCFLACCCFVLAACLNTSTKVCTRQVYGTLQPRAGCAGESNCMCSLHVITSSATTNLVVCPLQEPWPSSRASSPGRAQSASWARNQHRLLKGGKGSLRRTLHHVLNSAAASDPLPPRKWQSGLTQMRCCQACYRQDVSEIDGIVHSRVTHGLQNSQKAKKIATCAPP